MKQKADVLIVGTGAAGLFCALQLSEHLEICMISKQDLENSDSYLAQGGISTLKNEQDYASYYMDTMKAGHYENDPLAVEMMIRSSPEIIDDLLRCGVEFEHDQQGMSYTREGAHSAFRILHHEDETGREITSKLLTQVQKRKNISLYPYTCMLDIVCNEEGCHGAVVRCQDGSLCTIAAKVVVWATGGVGGLFDSSTNFAHLTGDAVALSLLHGIHLKDINYIQIHPTTLYSKEKGRRFLISESVRGEGAVLLNAKGERFVDELLPRDVVSQAIHAQMEMDHRDYVWLSVVHLGAEKIQKRFPHIYQHCLEKGYDITKEPIPVTPAQHYFMGGVAVDLESCTSMPHLYAVGETACNGVHGKNRLASNSLLESLVFAKRAAKSLQKTIGQIDFMPMPTDLSAYEDTQALAQKYRTLVLNEIKRRDASFYDQWCHDGSQCG